MKYNEYLNKRNQELIKAFKDIKGDATYHGVYQNPHPYHYRHKVTLSATNVNNKLRLGLFVPSTKKIKPQVTHEFHDKLINDCMVTIESLFNKYKLLAYDSKTPKGLIKHVVIKKSFDNNDLLVTIATQTNLLPNSKGIINELVAAHKEVKTVVQNIHNKDTKFAILEQEKVLYGKGYIEDKIDDLTFRISSASFYQVNPYIAFPLYEKAIKSANIKSNETVFDCYSGVGTLTLLIGKYAKNVYGIEINKEAHKNALINKTTNKMSHVNFINGDANKIFSDQKLNPNTVFVDPTRTGLSKEFINSLNNSKPNKIVYISCNYNTQIRDIKFLLKNYKLVSIEGFDMFSFTDEIETLCILERKK